MVTRARESSSFRWVVAVGLMFGPAFLSGAASVPEGAAAVFVMPEDECCDVANCEGGPHNCISWTDPETGKPVECKKGGSEECEQ